MKKFYIQQYTDELSWEETPAKTMNFDRLSEAVTFCIWLSSYIDIDIRLTDNSGLLRGIYLHPIRGLMD